MKMTREEFCKTIDHAILWQNNSREVVEKRCREVVKYGFACICCNPCEVAFARSIIKDAAGVCAVVGYPMGANTTKTKVFEALDALENGANEIDMVMNYGLLKSHEYEKVIHEITLMSHLCHQHHVGLKVIVETDALTKEEIKAAVECCIKGEADFIKTSTGYLKSEHLEGASPDVIRLIVETAQGRIKVKGSGCVRSRERLVELIELGIDRAGVGCSSTEKILGVSYD